MIYSKVCLILQEGTLKLRTLKLILFIDKFNELAIITCEMFAEFICTKYVT